MKKIFKTTLILMLSIIFINCDDDRGLNEGKFNVDPESGWIDITSDNSSKKINVASIICSNLTPQLTTIEIPVTLNSSTNKNGLDVTYEVEELIGGNPENYITYNGEFRFEAGSLESQITLHINTNHVFSSDISFNVNLISTSRTNVSVGLSDNSKITSTNVIISLYDLEGTFQSTSVIVPTFGGAAAPAFTATVTPIDGQSNQWNLDTAWGTGFIAWATGSAGFEGLLIYPSIIEIDPTNGDVTIIGNDPDDGFGDYDTGGSGTYDRCTGILTYTLDSSFFGGIVVDVEMQLQ